MTSMTSKQIFDAGWAIPLYDLALNLRTWRYRDEEYRLPADAVYCQNVIGVWCNVARIEDVRAAARAHG